MCNNKIGRFTFSNTKKWTINSEPNLALLLVDTPGLTSCEATVYIDSSTAKNLDSIGINRDGFVACNMILNGTCTVPTIPINAGIGQILTITGHGFGNNRGTGNISFVNADDPDPIRRVFLDDPFDWTNPGYPPAIWTDTLIKVVLPSRDTISKAPSIVLGTPGSGLVKVTNNDGSVFTSTDSLNIDFAIITIGHSKKPTRLSRYQCINGFTFFLGNNIGINSPERFAIEAACNAWADKLNIDIKLSLNLQIPETKGNDTSVIYLTTVNNPLDSTVNMSTKPYAWSCSNNSFITESDIAIKPNPVGGWHTGLGNTLLTGKKDFYAAILHEIGHALGLMHSVDLVNYEKELMYYGTPFGATGGTLPIDRTNLITGGGQSAFGDSNFVVIPSRLINFSGSGCANFNTLTSREVSSPTISYSDTATCIYRPVTLTSSAQNGTAFGNTVSNLWSTGATTQSITVTSPGPYALVVSQNNCLSWDQITLKSLIISTINAQPVNDTSCLGSIATFSVSAAAGSSFQWQRSLNGGISWSDLKNDANYIGVTTNNLHVLHVNYFNGLQWYQCMVKNGQAYCPQPSNKAILYVDLVQLQPFASILTNGSAFHLTGGTPAGGTYWGDSVIKIGVDYIYSPPNAPTTGLIYYAFPGCLPEQVSQQIQVIDCALPPCDIITTNLSNGYYICLDFSTTISVPYTAIGSFASGNTFTAYLSDKTGSFNNLNQIGSLLSNAPNGFISCFIPANIAYSSSYRIRIAADSPFVYGEPSPFDIAITNNCDEQRTSAIADLEVNLYPNPTFGSVTIEFKNKEPSKKEIQIIDLQGRVFVNRRLNSKENSVLIEIATLDEGMYIVVIKTANSLAQKKLIVTAY